MSKNRSLCVCIDLVICFSRRSPGRLDDTFIIHLRCTIDREIIQFDILEYFGTDTRIIETCVCVCVCDNMTHLQAVRAINYSVAVSLATRVRCVLLLACTVNLLCVYRVARLKHKAESTGCAT